MGDREEVPLPAEASSSWPLPLYSCGPPAPVDAWRPQSFWPESNNKTHRVDLVIKSIDMM